jgi:uracil phosphoribosyltransferase
MNLHVVDHPLASHALHHLRDRQCRTGDFRHYSDLATSVVLLEVLRHLPTVEGRVQTPLEVTSSRHLASIPVWIPVLRAGLAMLRVAQAWFPDAEVGMMGLERDEVTACAKSYYEKLPDLEGRPVVVLDPMLATGGSLCHVLRRILASRNPASLQVACVVAAPEGVAVIQEQFPSVRIVTASLDRGLNERAYIVPGLGDFGDRYHGTC